MTTISEVRYTFAKEHAPLHTAKPGERVTFITQDCFSGGIRTERDLTKNFNYDKANPATGPVFLEGAEPGDILVAHIEKIEVGDQGVVTTLPKIGPLFDRMVDRTKVLKVSKGKTMFNDKEITLRPMIGVIGVAPEGEAVGCGFPGNHGGNLDCKFMGEGATLYLPVRVKGGLFQLGDLHAVMGDGELVGTGMEICGKVTVTLGLIKKCKLDWPVLETEDAWHAMASDLDFTQALIKSCRQIQDLICAAYGWDQTDAYLYLSLEGDLGANQACQPCPVPMILRVSIPKRADKRLLPKA